MEYLLVAAYWAAAAFGGVLGAVLAVLALVLAFYGCCAILAVLVFVARRLAKRHRRRRQARLEAAEREGRLRDMAARSREAAELERTARVMRGQSYDPAASQVVDIHPRTSRPSPWITLTDQPPPEAA